MTLRIGDKFGRWTIIGECVKENGKHKKYLCECSCEKKTQRYVDEYNLKRGVSSSCGCITAEEASTNFSTHRKTKERLYHVWSSMKGRCCNPNNQAYDSYGGRGIKICDEWKNDYMAFRKWALESGYDENASLKDCTIERIDVNGNYEPSNCTWVDAKQQANNRRSNVYITYKGETHNLIEWSEITGIDRRKISTRYKKGYPLEDVFFCGNFRKGKRRVV